jgi:hypothetical protein
MNFAIPDHYQQLGLSPDASLEAIRKRHRDLARRYHPDVDSSAESAEKIRRINEAYHALSDLERRSAYDLTLCQRMWGAVTLVNRNSWNELEANLHYWQFRILMVDGTNTTDAATLCQAANRVLPHPLGDPICDWNSLEDGLWQGLADMADRGECRIAICWTHAHAMLKSGLPDLLLAIDCFRGLAAQVTTSDQGFPHPMALRTFLIGEGPNFPGWRPPTARNEER